MDDSSDTIPPSPVPHPRLRRRYHWLAVVPTLGMLGGVPFVNRATPRVAGLPPLMAWMIAWVVLTSGIMGLIYVLDRRHDR